MPKGLIYAVGDIHGRLDLLELAFEQIQAHLAGRCGLIVCLGDYIDRGPDSRGVIEFLIQLQQLGVAKCLKGNHEDMMLRAYRERTERSTFDWLLSGGDATLRSYGADEPGLSSLDVVPREHLLWMADLPTIAEDAHRFYVHAGLAPGKPVAEQDGQAHLWVREEFLRATRREAFPDGKHVVHGHTPYWEKKPNPWRPELLAHRTNLDTAAYHSGVLSVGVFDPDAAGGPVEVLAICGEPFEPELAPETGENVVIERRAA